MLHTIIDVSNGAEAMDCVDFIQKPSDDVHQVSLYTVQYMKVNKK